MMLSLCRSTCSQRNLRLVLGKAGQGGWARVCGVKVCHRDVDGPGDVPRLHATWCDGSSQTWLSSQMTQPVSEDCQRLQLGKGRASNRAMAVIRVRRSCPAVSQLTTLQFETYCVVAHCADINDLNGASSTALGQNLVILVRWDDIHSGLVCRNRGGQSLAKSGDVSSPCTTSVCGQNMVLCLHAVWPLP